MQNRQIMHVMMYAKNAQYYAKKYADICTICKIMQKYTKRMIC